MSDNRGSSADTATSVPGVVVLEHPAGSQVYLVGTAHVSAQAPQEVTNTVQSTSPQVVVLELDPERLKHLLEAAKNGDEYGLQRQLKHGRLQPIYVALNGQILTHMLSMAYVIGGALLGSPAGAEFVAAVNAAKQVGAEVVCGDRDAKVTMQRLMWRAAQLRRERKREGAIATQLTQSPQHSITYTASGSSAADSYSRPDSQADAFDTDASTEPGSSRGKKKDLWGLDDDSTSGTGTGEGGRGRGSPAKQRGTDLAGSFKQKWTRLLQQGGCENAEEVTAAFQRILKEGGQPHAVIDMQDLLTVRQCGHKVVEAFRQSALQKGGDAQMHDLERLSMAAAKNMAGIQEANMDAITEVLLHERNVILARRMYEAGDRAQGRPVVGVVGAGHIRGIMDLWPKAGESEFAAKAESYCKPPPGSVALPGGNMWPLVATGVGLYVLSRRRPRLAAGLTVAGTVLLGPPLYMMISTARWAETVAQNIVEAAQRLPPEDGAVGSGWQDSGMDTDALQ